MMIRAWSQKGIGGTAGTFLGLLAISTLPQIGALAATPLSPQTKWTGKHEPSTASSHAGLLSGTYAVVDRPFEVQMALAYENFVAGQKPLEPEFAEILVANLWNLYER